MRITQQEYDTLTNRYNEVRSLNDSYLREIKELQMTITELTKLIDSRISCT